MIFCKYLNPEIEENSASFYNLSTLGNLTYSGLIKVDLCRLNSAH